jgi:hypothetical protein
MTYNLHTAFGREVVEQLTRREIIALMRDIRAIIEDERRTGEDACKVLRSRIGGPGNLKAYVASLTAGERARARRH